MLTKNDLNQIRGIVKEEIEPVKKDVNSLKKDMKSVKHDISRLRKDQGTMLNLLDKEQMQQRKRITKLEEHVGISATQ